MEGVEERQCGLVEILPISLLPLYGNSASSGDSTLAEKIRRFSISKFGGGSFGAETATADKLKQFATAYQQAKPNKKSTSHGDDRLKHLFNTKVLRTRGFARAKSAIFAAQGHKDAT